MAWNRWTRPLLTSTSATTHGTHNPYDQRVPVIVFGTGIKPGAYAAPATPADTVPTFAAAAGVDLGTVDGRVLSEALTGGGQ